MITLRRMKKQDVPMLYAMALRAFRPDYETYGVYPPLLKTEKGRFLPPRLFGRVILDDDVVIGGVFVVALASKGELGAIFIDPDQQKKGYGRQVMLEIERQYPRVRRWKLDTPSGSKHLHRFYESLGYVKTGEIRDPKSGMTGFVYEKNRGPG